VTLTLDLLTPKKGFPMTRRRTFVYQVFSDIVRMNRQSNAGENCPPPATAVGEGKYNSTGCALVWQISVGLAPYGLRDGNAPWFMRWFRSYIVCLFTLLPSSLPSFFTFFLMLSFLLIFFLDRLLSDLSIYFFQNRSVPFPSRLEVVGGDQTWL